MNIHVKTLSTKFDDIAPYSLWLDYHNLTIVYGLLLFFF